MSAGNDWRVGLSHGCHDYRVRGDYWHLATGRKARRAEEACTKRKPKPKHHKPERRKHKRGGGL